jgi:16S rRNA (guanine966-N2)-methyltransferase
MGVGEQRVRIVAGEFRGRRIEAPKGQDTRPTTDRVREALFSSLGSIAGPGLGGGSALDAFAGTGALGLEALSRGVDSVTFIECDRAALAAVRRNIETCGVQSRTRLVTGDAVALAGRGAIPGGPFALLLLDPPYRLDAGEVATVISQLVVHDLLGDEALIMLERASDTEPVWPEGVRVLTQKRYGTTSVDIAIWERGEGS